ncbi:phosphatase PAP2 family protein [Ensifer adhaerens]|uniref:phosphatase PAP2 family protein n=1 Tax=Ensifer adhaerens TaxID=106592 RepID=UPI001CBEAE6E|nr:phosphatase PAP2 family protein [Ensifer adhaerens]MBZ7922095.1 phosphatase PAP2 family protein [Ensifer adhaerens]UAX94481.1 phosphatase PAP2 family protein [Ensifer adhaerens]UAY02116.1 phosphatase PAP2 family protein [Ensifer adhaerens]UAY09499.1 phosphatase PAP2 family protein [Ensifer adhaerens]
MEDFSQARLFLIAGTIFSYGALLLTSSVSGFPLSFEGWLYEAAAFATAVCAASFLALRFNFHQLRPMIECCGCGLLLVVPITLSTYLSARTNFPLADHQLSGWDKWLGIDWSAMMAWIDRHYLLSEALNKAYRSFAYQLLLCPALLVLSNHHRRAYQMVGAYALLCFLSSAISIFFPALGAYAYYQFDASSLQHINATYGYLFLEEFHAVRNDPNFIWRLPESQGIVTFPSVHAAVAVLCAWALWPVRLLRYPALVLNLAMGFSAIPAGSHYAVDVIAGMAVAVASIGFVTRPVGQRSTALSAPATPSPVPTQS